MRLDFPTNFGQQINIEVNNKRLWTQCGTFLITSTGAIYAKNGLIYISATGTNAPVVLHPGYEFDPSGKISALSSFNDFRDEQLIDVWKEQIIKFLKE